MAERRRRRMTSMPFSILAAAILIATLSSISTSSTSSNTVVVVVDAFATLQTSRRSISVAVPLSLSLSKTAEGSSSSSNTGSSSNNNNTNKAKQGGGGGGKKRRFLQAAHPSAAAIVSSSKPPKPKPKQQSQQQNQSKRPNQPPQPQQMPSGAQRKQQQPSAAIGGSNNNNNNNNNSNNNNNIRNVESKTGFRTSRGPPLQTSKSIDELEAILEKRWGTAQATKNERLQTGSTEDNADFVLSFDMDGDDFDDGTNAHYDDDDDDAEKKSATRMALSGLKNGLKTPNGASTAATTSSSSSSSSNNKVRSKRVMDPWAEEEGIYNKGNRNYDYDDNDEREGNENNANDHDANSNNNNNKMSRSSAADKNKKKDRYAQEEAMLNRVRANQDRLQKGRKSVVATTTNSSGKQEEKLNNYNVNAAGDDESEIDNFFNVPVDLTQDYYDEDDEGYEVKQRPSLASPRPVGGKGSLSSSFSSSSSSSMSGGIFSDRSTPATSARRNDNEDLENDDYYGREEDTTKQRKNKKRKEPTLPPMLDEDGNEMLLTLEQANRIVKSILNNNNNNSDNDDDGDDDSSLSQTCKWNDLGITHPILLANLNSRSMSCPTPLPVQEKACPPIVSGNDVLVSTHTGSGKTLAFLAPLAQSLLTSSTTSASSSSGGASFPKVIIIAPGRELASQIVSVAQTLFAGTGLSASLAIGGTTYSRNVENIRKKKPDIVVGTPGRIAELVVGRVGDKGGKLKISGLQTVVLDEFDALLQYDAHKEPTMAILDAMNRQHGESLQKVLCSATATDMLGEQGAKGGGGTNVEAYLRPGYAHASVDDDDLLVTSGVKQETKGGAVKTSARVSKTTIHGRLHVTHQRFQLDAVRKIMNTDPSPQQALIFVDSPRRVDIVIEKLSEMGIVAAPLHGGGGKSDRAEVNKALREGYVGLVVATEMAARGIDAPYLTHVINLDLPTDASHYAHRAGRCGRGGRPGVALTITCDHREKGVPKRMAEELGITMHTVEAREGKLRIVQE